MFSAGFAEVVLIVKDVRAAASFYGEVVGLKPRSEPNESWAWFWAGESDQPQSLALHQGPLLFEEKSPYPEGARWGHVHYAFNVPREKLPQAVAHLGSYGVDIYGPVQLGWMRAVSYYFYDPDGNLLEFWSPDPSSR